MMTEAAIDRMKQELHRAIDCMRRDLARVETLTAAVCAFSRPIPEYEPAFRHTHKLTRGVQELGRSMNG